MAKTLYEKLEELEDPRKRRIILPYEAREIQSERAQRLISEQVLRIESDLKKYLENVRAIVQPYEDNPVIRKAIHNKQVIGYISGFLHPLSKKAKVLFDEYSKIKKKTFFDPKKQLFMGNEEIVNDLEGILNIRRKYNRCTICPDEPSAKWQKFEYAMQLRAMRLPSIVLSNLGVPLGPMGMLASYLITKKANPINLILEGYLPGFLAQAGIWAYFVIGYEKTLQDTPKNRIATPTDKLKEEALFLDQCILDAYPRK